jgi:RecA/RadA recombinase
MPPPRPISPVPVDASRLERLLRDLRPQVRRGALPALPPPRCPTGIPAIDGLLGGGFPCGHLSEVAGATSSGRTALALGLLAETTRAGEIAAVVDAADAFDAASAAAAGAALERVLWVRAPHVRAALRSVERLLEVRGFPLVLVDLVGREARDACSPPVWSRLARAAAGAQAALVLLVGRRLAGTSAELALEMEPRRACFVGTPALLEELEVQAVLARTRSGLGGAAGRAASVRLHVLGSAA